MSMRKSPYAADGKFQLKDFYIRGQPRIFSERRKKITQGLSDNTRARLIACHISSKNFPEPISKIPLVRFFALNARPQRHPSICANIFEIGSCLFSAQ
ncbi:MAG: hypothetical protein HY274_08040 [Gammaproteobacteria bacterium]|nr:hypothetical protein [Gammaproteobacteria bacterium]